MTDPRIRRLVLDAQGVVFNAPIPRFLGEFARALGIAEADVRARWHDTVRGLAWMSGIDDAALWRELADGAAADVGDPTPALESRYTPGPAADRLAAWQRRVPIWLLSNHRSHWILPRLERFGFAARFERVLVSDTLGSMKPEAAAFRAAAAGLADPREALFVDDAERNVEAARRVGLAAIHASPHRDWLAEVDARLES